MPGFVCDSEARNDEGILFEDVNGDGAMDMILSYHGAAGLIPKFTLQLFLGDANYPGKFKRVKAFERRFYGANYILRAMDQFPNRTYKFYQNYIIEYLSFKFTKINDGALDFSK